MTPGTHTTRPGQALVPRPHQQRAVDDVAAAFADHTRASAYLPCGAGKTMIGAAVADRLGVQLTLVVVPSLALIAQTLTAWRRSGNAAEALVVCSDPTTAAGVAERAASDGGDLEASSWSASRAVVTTDVEQARRTLTRWAGRPLAVFSTYQSVRVVATAARAAGVRFGLVVADEAHHLSGAPRQEFRDVLDDGLLPAERRLFMTATPVDAPPGPLLSMSDTALFGPVAHRLGFGEAIEQQILSDYEVLVFEAAGQATPHPVAALQAAASGVRSLLTFHGRVQKARAFADAVDGLILPDGRRVVAWSVAGTDPVAVRTRVLQLLEQPRSEELVVVSSARCLSEGVDLPAVDGVMFVDPKASELSTVQSVGRVLRRSPGKTRGRVLIPVCVPAGLDDATVLATSAFAGVWRVLRGLRALDSRLVDDLATILRAPSRRGQHDGSRTTRLRVELPSLHDESRFVARAVEVTSQTWDRLCAELESYAAGHGSARPGGSLGQWCERQRTARRRGLLEPERVERLRAIPGWMWDLAEQRWLDQWAQVRSLARRNGRLQLADSASMDLALVCRQRGSTLLTVGTWCARQRQLARHGDLDAARKARLGEIPGWTWSALDPADEACVELLGEYTAWKGDANPPAGYVEEDHPVGRWLNEVRRRRATGRLEQPLLDELDAVTADVPAGGQLRWFRPEALWMLGLEALREFARREQSCRIPDGHLESLPDCVIPLSVWCRRQRHAHRYGDLSAARISLLEAVPGWRWEVQPAPRVLMEIGDARHGSRTGYVKGCRCEPCTEANRADHSQRAAREAQGRPGTDWVSANAARGHLRILAGQGAQAKPLARACGLNIKTVEGLLSGTTRRIHPATECAVLQTGLAQVRLAAEPGTRVPAGPTWELVDDLRSRGWPKAWIAREIGQSHALQLSRTFISAENATRVADLHRRLGSMTPPPRTHRASLPTLADLAPALAQTA